MVEKYSLSDCNARMINALRHPLATNTFWILLERVFQIFFGLFVSGLIAKYFGVELYGKWQYALSIVVLATALTWTCGAEVIVPKLSNATNEECSGILGTALIIRIVNSLIVGFVFYVTVTFIFQPGEVRTFLYGLGISIFFREPFMIVFSWLQSRTNIRPAMLANILSLLVKSALVAALIAFNSPPVFFALVWVLEVILIGIFLFFYFRRQRISLRFDKKNILPYIKLGFYFWIGCVSMYALIRIDRMFLEYYATPEIFGRYAVALQLLENWVAIGATLSQSVGPMLIYRLSTPWELRKMVIKLLCASTLISLFGSLMLVLIVPYVIKYIFGVDFDGAVSVFNKVVWLSVIVNSESVLNAVMYKFSAGKFVAYKLMFGVLISAFSSYILVPRLGSDGAIISLYIGFSFALIVSGVYFFYRVKGSWL